MALLFEFMYVMHAMQMRPGWVKDGFFAFLYA